MTGPTTKPLNGKQMKALSAVLCTPTLAAASKLSGVPERTIFRYLRLAHFATAYKAARDEQVAQAVANLQRLAFSATETLEKILTDSWCKPSSRVAAAKCVLSFILRESDEGRSEPPTEPACDWSALTPAEWATFKQLYLKVRPYKTQALPLPAYYPTNKGD